jgi:hypothetical protein
MVAGPVVQGVQRAADVVAKVAGACAVVGLFIGVIVFAKVDCVASAGFGTAKRCSNLFGDVTVNAAGQPDYVWLGAKGALIGAVVGGLGGAAVAWLSDRRAAETDPM